MEKTFTGEIIASELNEFTSDRGETVTLWKISLALSEEKSITFNVSKQTNEDLFNRVQDALPGMTVKATCIPKATNQGGIKWKLTDLALA